MFDSLLDHKNPLSEDLFPLFGIEHQLQRFDKRLIGIDIDEQCTPPLETYKKFYPRTARENEKLYLCIKF